MSRELTCETSWYWGLSLRWAGNYLEKGHGIEVILLGFYLECGHGFEVVLSDEQGSTLREVMERSWYWGLSLRWAGNYLEKGHGIEVILLGFYLECGHGIEVGLLGEHGTTLRLVMVLRLFSSASRALRWVSSWYWGYSLRWAGPYLECHGIEVILLGEQGLTFRVVMVLRSFSLANKLWATSYSLVLAGSIGPSG